MALEKGPLRAGDTWPRLGSETLAAFSGVPVYNGLTDDFHPTRVPAWIGNLQKARAILEGRAGAQIMKGGSFIPIDTIVRITKTTICGTVQHFARSA